MDPITEAVIEKALELLKAGKKQEAQTILVPLAKQHPDIPDSWYLLGFTVTDLQEKRYCFQQVLRIDPSNEAAQRQLAKLLQQPAHPQPHTPYQPEPASNPSEEATGNRTLTIALILGVVAMIALLAGITFYVFNGSNTNNRVNVLFMQHQCAEVVQYTSFEDFFPREIFSSFRMYKQMDECQTQLKLAEAVKAQDLENAYSFVESYFAEYPQGAFTKEVNEQAGDILLSWSRRLIDQNDYKAAIEKLEMIQTKFSTSPANAVAAKTMLDDYLLWGQYLFKQKDYENAEKSFITVASNTKASLEQVKQANDDLVSLYLEWGKVQVENGRYAQGIASYEKARVLNPTLMNYDNLENRASLLQAAALRKTGDFDQALGIIHALLGAALSDENKADVLAEQASILDAYAHATSAQAQAQMAATATNLCKDQLPTLPIFGTDANVVRLTVEPGFPLDLPSNMLAATPAELRYVVCIKQSGVTIESCEYQKGYVVHRNYYVWELSLYDITSGTPYQTNTFKGSTPRKCEDKEPFFNTPSKIAEIYGDPPKTQEIIDWLNGLKIVR